MERRLDAQQGAVSVQDFQRQAVLEWAIRLPGGRNRAAPFDDARLVAYPGNNAAVFFDLEIIPAAAMRPAKARQPTNTAAAAIPYTTVVYEPRSVAVRRASPKAT